MADQSDINHSAQAQPTRDLSLPQTPPVAVSGSQSPNRYVSPAYDLRQAPSRSYVAQAPATNPQVVSVGEETIQIAPHPTTNRYPWTAVDNPRVPIYQTVAVAKPQAPAEAPPDTPVIAAPSPPPTPLPPLVAKPELKPLPPTPAPLPVKPELLVTPPPVKPVSPPPEVPAAPPPELAPAVKSEPQPAEPAVQHQPNQKPVKIYSESTQAVWHVFRPNKLLRIVFVAFVVLLIIGSVAFWHASGSPKNLMDLPVIQSITHAK